MLTFRSLSRPLSRVPSSLAIPNAAPSLIANKLLISYSHYSNLPANDSKRRSHHSLIKATKISLRHRQADSYTRSFFNLVKKRFHDPNPDAAEAERLVTSLANPTANHPDILKAAELSKKAVDEGDSPRGKTLLGSLYREGFGVKKDLLEAERLFLEASEAGDPIAQCSLGVLKLSGLKTRSHEQPHFDMAVAVNEEGDYLSTIQPSTVEKLDQENQTSQNESNESEVVEGNDEQKIETPAEMVRKIRKARKEAGFTDDQAREFEEYKEREETKHRTEVREDAHKWLELAIDQGNDQAILALANDLVMENPERAIELYELGAKTHRNVQAYYSLGQIYERGVGNVKRDLRASFRYFSMAAQLGDAAAQLYMGSLYHRGSFVVDVDFNLAKRYIEMAVAQNHPAALHYYALMHRTGECDIEQSQEKFIEYAFEAVKFGEYGPALALLADIHYQGTDGVEVDHEKALEYFERAGRAGESDCLCSAAAMYFHGTGVKENKRKAFELYQDAAVKGSVKALRNIASMYFYGHGVPVNRNMSEHFMKCADEMEKEQNERAKGNTGDVYGSKEEGAEIITEQAPEIQGIMRQEQIPAPDSTENKASESVRGG